MRCSRQVKVVHYVNAYIDERCMRNKGPSDSNSNKCHFFVFRKYMMQRGR